MKYVYVNPECLKQTCFIEPFPHAAIFNSIEAILPEAYTIQDQGIFLDMAGQIIHQIDWPQYNIRVGEVAPIALQLRDSVENILRVYYAPSNSFTDYSVEVCKTVPHCTVEAGKIPKIARIGFKSVTLEKITEAQQKIKWNRLKIIVVPEPSTNNRWSPEEMNVIH